MQFTDLNLMEPILRAITAEGYTEPTPIQAQAIPPILDGHDLVGCAQTGTGKTAAFSLPILQRLTETRDHNQKRRPIRALILTPTRELAAQITENMRTYGRYTGTRCAVIYGGVNQNPQVKKLQKGVDVLIATPGRLLDLVNQGHIDLSRVEVFVLDEADRMLDMGFIHDMRRVVKLLPKQRQTLLFSATMPPAIEDLARQMLDKPVSVSVAPQATTVETIDQSVFFVDKGNKKSLLLHILNQDKRIERVLIFTRTKHGADNLVKKLNRSKINADAIHGNKSQSARERALSNFKSGNSRVLVATDIASRGIDVDDVTHVINFDLPNEPESYVHRIGRTARAGASGVAYSFCDVEERKYLRDIEKVIRLKVPVVDEHPFPAENTEPEPAPKKKSKGRNRRSSSDHRSNNGGGSKNNRNRNRNRRRKVASDNQRQGSSKSS